MAANTDRTGGERAGYMLGTPEDRAALAAYLDVLDRTHADDPAMCAHVRSQRERLAEYDHPEVARGD